MKTGMSPEGMDTEVCVGQKSGTQSNKTILTWEFTIYALLHKPFITPDYFTGGRI